MPDPHHDVRVAGAGDVDAAAALLHAFNVEFATPTPELDVVASRLRAMLSRDDVLLLLAGAPPVALALMTFRPVVWDAGPVALLDELYVRPDLRGQGIGGRLLGRAIDAARARGTETFEINVDEGDADARRFYERHAFALTEPGRDERALYYSRRLADDAAGG